MLTLAIKRDPRMDETFQSYPPHAKEKLLHLRKLILEAAEELGIKHLEETLKWGEPSYLAKKGSTIRMDWKAKAPQQYAMYFKCTSQLVPTFKAVFPEDFQYEGNRAIVFQLDDIVPEQALKACIKAGLQYHQVKHLPMLGM